MTAIGTCLPASAAVVAGLVAALAGPPAGAQEILPPEAFEAMSEGRTLHFSLLGRPFGAEQYFDGRRSLWRFAGGDCVAGRWESRGESICFSYEDEPGRSQCWHLRRDGNRFVAVALAAGGEETEFRLDLDRIDRTPLACGAPDVGS